MPSIQEYNIILYTNREQVRVEVIDTKESRGHNIRRERVFLLILWLRVGGGFNSEELGKR